MFSILHLSCKAFFSLNFCLSCLESCRCSQFSVKCEAETTLNWVLMHPLQRNMIFLGWIFSIDSCLLLIYMINLITSIIKSCIYANKNYLEVVWNKPVSVTCIAYHNRCVLISNLNGNDNNIVYMELIVFDKEIIHWVPLLSMNKQLNHL